MVLFDYFGRNSAATLVYQIRCLTQSLCHDSLNTEGNVHWYLRVGSKFNLYRSIDIAGMSLTLL